MIEATAYNRPATFADLFSAEYGRLWVLAAALIGDRVEAEDLVQEAALVGMRKFRQFEAGSNFVAWMSQIVRLQASNWRSKQARRRTRPTDPTDLQLEPALPGEGRAARMADSAAGDLGPLAETFDEGVVRALDALPAEPRACLLLRVVHELDYAQIAEMLGIPPGTAMSHVHRSRAKLRRSLGGEAVEGME